MMGRTERPVLLRGAVELVLWFSMAALFLVAYVGRNGLPFDTVTEHLRVFGASVCALALLRMAIAAWFPEWLARWGQAALSTVFLLGWMCLYALVLIGLHYWGEVITPSILIVYGRQGTTLLSTLGIPVWGFVAVTLTLLVGVLLGFWKVHAQPHWTLRLVSAWGWRRLFPFGFGTFALILIEIFRLDFYLHVPSHEPVALMLRSRVQAGGQITGADGPAAERLKNGAEQARRAYRPSQEAIRANLILIVVDALRDDHLGVNGYERQTTPHLARWLERTAGLNLGQTRSSCSSSICGITGLVTSRFAHQQTAAAMSLHEALALHGWSRHLLMGGDHANFYGLRQRYGKVDTYIDGLDAPSAMLNDDRFLLESLDRLSQKVQQPALLHFHLMSAHVLGCRFLDERPFGEQFNYSNPAFRIKRDHVQLATNYYDHGVLQTDHVINQILERLMQLGMLSHALVVITGDHGEHLGEHGRFSHANGVMEPAVRVPWLMLPFGLSLAEVNLLGRRHHIDIAPTVLDLLRIPIPSDWSGKTMLNRQISPPFSHLAQGEEVAVIDHRQPPNEHKFVLNLRTDSESVHDLAIDPLEIKPLMAADKELLKAWRDEVIGPALTLKRSLP